MKTSMHALLALTLATCLPVALLAGENTWTTQGPFGGRVKAIEVDNQGNVYAGIDGNGVYLSTDNGATWTDYGTGLTDPRVQDLVIVDSVSPVVLFAATNGGGVFRRENGAGSWTEVNGSPPNDLGSLFVLSLVTDPDFADNDTIYAGTNGGGTFKSADRGATWSEANLGLGQRVVFDLEIPSRRQFDLVVNEVNAHDGGAGLEFLEIFGPPNTSLNGVVLVLYVGSNFPSDGCETVDVVPTGQNPVYAAYDLAGFALNGVGIFVIGDPAVANVDYSPGGFDIDDGPAAIALHVGTGSDFPTGRSAFRDISMLDAIVYETGDFDDSCLLTSLDFSDADPSDSIDESSLPATSANRWTDGGVAFDVEAWRDDFLFPYQLTPSPGLRNDPIDTVLASTDLNGVYISEDGGGFWFPLNNNLGVGTGFALAFDGTDPTGCIEETTPYVGTNGGGVYRATDHCDPFILEDWEAFNDDLTDLTVLSLAVAEFDDPALDALLYAGTEEGRVFRTVLSGGDAAWVEVSNGIEGVFVDALRVDPLNSGSEMWAGTDGGGVFRTVDAAANWFQTGPSLDVLSGLFVRMVGIDPLDSTVLYAATFGGGVFKSIDSGSGWTAFNNGIPVSGVGASSRFVASLAIDPSSSQILYVGTDLDGVFKSVDGAANWVSVNTGLGAGSVVDLDIDPATPTTVYAVATSVFKTTNGGASWFSASNGLPAAIGGESAVVSLVVNPSNTTEIFAATRHDGVFRSPDGGANWAPANFGLSSSFIREIAVDPSNDLVLYAGTEGDGLFKSLDGSGSWFRIGADQGGSSYITNDFVIALDIDPVDTDVLYAGTDGGGVFKSRDGGLTWSEFNVGLGNLVVMDLRVDASDPRQLYAGTNGAGVYDIFQAERLVIQPTEGLVTTEAGGTAVFSVSLTQAPSADVFLDVSSSNTDEGVVDRDLLKFTSLDWAVPQVVTVTGVPDGVLDGDTSYLVVLDPLRSDDPSFDGIDPDDISAINLEVLVGFSIDPIVGHTTDEGGGQTTFTVALISLPTADVTIPLASSDTTEGTVSPSSLTFTSVNGQTPQTVTVTGQPDFVADGDIVYQIVLGPVSSADLTWDGLDPPDVSVTNLDSGEGLLFQTATLGATGQGTSSGFHIRPDLFLGAKFEATQTVTVTSVGGHVVGNGADRTIFVAIVPLDAGTDLPAQENLGDALFSTVFTAPFPSEEVTIPVPNLELPAGRYGVLFGSGLFGATGAAMMPNNDTNVLFPEYFYWNVLGFWNGGATDARFFLSGFAGAGPAPIFSDGFESGNTTAWSATSP